MERELNRAWLERGGAELEEPAYARPLRALINRLVELAQFNPARAGFGPSVRRRDLPLWSKLAELFLVYFSVKLLVCQLAQHEHNRLTSGMESLSRTSRWANQSTLAQHTLRLQQMSRDLQRSSQRLDLIGAPWRELGQSAEIVYVAVLVFIAGSYATARLLALAHGQMDADLARFFQAPAKERKIIHANICELAARYLASGDNYLRASLEVDAKTFHRSPTGGDARDRAGDPPDFRHKLSAGPTHWTLVRDVSRLVRSGRLEPLNRNLHWLTRLERQLLFFIVYMLTGCALILAFVGFIYPQYILPGFRYHLGPSDLWFMAEVALYVAIGVSLCCFYSILLAGISIDQIKYAEELRGLIRAAMLEIDQSGARLNNAAATSSSRSADISRMHMSVAAVLLQLRMFRAQIAPIQRIKGLAFNAIVTLMAVAPLLARTNISQMTNRRKVALVVSSLMINCLADSIIWPSCHLYARCLDLYHNLASLMAHLVAVTHQGGRQLQTGWLTSGLSYSQRLLMAELSMPEGMAAKFATSTIFGKITWNHSIGVHFWCGILLMSFWFRSGNSTGNSLADSFWIF